MRSIVNGRRKALRALSLFGKMCPDVFPQETMLSAVCWPDLSAQVIPCVVQKNADGGLTLAWLPGRGHGRLGGFSMLNISASPNDAAACSLSSVLETAPIPPRYFLSPQACAGILRRAARRKKTLPPQLQAALESVAGSAMTMCPPSRTRSTPKGGGGRIDGESETFVVHGSQDPCVGRKAFALGRNSGQENAVFAINLRGRDGGAMPECDTLASLRAADGGSSRSYVQTHAVRRLTPTECERLQGFPDGYTQVPFRGKPMADGPRYKMIGNSWAVPKFAWLGRRLDAVLSSEHRDAA